MKTETKTGRLEEDFEVKTNFEVRPNTQGAGDLYDAMEDLFQKNAANPNEHFHSAVVRAGEQFLSGEKQTAMVAVLYPMASIPAVYNHFNYNSPSCGVKFTLHFFSSFQM